MKNGLRQSVENDNNNKDDETGEKGNKLKRKRMGGWLNHKNNFVKNVNSLTCKISIFESEEIHLFPPQKTELNVLPK